MSCIAKLPLYLNPLKYTLTYSVIAGYFSPSMLFNTFFYAGLFAQNSFLELSAHFIEIMGPSKP